MADETTETMVEGFPCPECGKSCKSERGLAMHVESHLSTRITKNTAPPPRLSSDPLPDSGHEAKPGRSIWMVQPVCENCQRGKNVPLNWVEHCPHGEDIYFETVTINRDVEETRVIEGGIEEVTGVRKTRIRQKRLRTVEVSLDLRHDAGKGYEIAKTQGYKRISEFRGPGNRPYPELCEYRGCSAPATARTQFGDYCGLLHARLVGAEQTEEILYVSENEAKRTAQLAGIATAG